MDRDTTYNEAIRELMHWHRLTQAQVAELTGYSLSSVKGWLSPPENPRWRAAKERGYRNLLYALTEQAPSKTESSRLYALVAKTEPQQLLLQQLFRSEADAKEAAEKLGSQDYQIRALPLRPSQVFGICKSDTQGEVLWAEEVFTTEEQAQAFIQAHPGDASDCQVVALNVE